MTFGCPMKASTILLELLDVIQTYEDKICENGKQNCSEQHYHDRKNLHLGRNLLARDGRQTLKLIPLGKHLGRDRPQVHTLIARPICKTSQVFKWISFFLINIKQLLERTKSPILCADDCICLKRIHHNNQPQVQLLQQFHYRDFLLKIDPVVSQCLVIWLAYIPYHCLQPVLRL